MQQPSHLQAFGQLTQTTNDPPICLRRSPGSEGRERARQVRGLLARKNSVEYESKKANAKDARDDVESASRIVEWAREVLAKARL